MSFIQQFFTSRDNNADGATFVGQQDRLWWNPDTNSIYVSDGVTPGGILVTGGGGGGNEIWSRNLRTATRNYTLPDTQNASSVGPITIEDGVTVSIGTSRWLIF